MPSSKKKPGKAKTPSPLVKAERRAESSTGKPPRATPVLREKAQTSGTSLSDVLDAADLLSNLRLECPDNVRDDGGRRLPLAVSVNTDKGHGNGDGSRICLSLEDMRTYGIHSGDVLKLISMETTANNGALITSERLLMVGRAWPLRELKAGKASISKVWSSKLQELSQNRSFWADRFLESFNGGDYAEMVTLSVGNIEALQQGNVDEEERTLFQAYLKFVLRGSYVFEGAILTAPAYGKSRQLNVLKVQPSNKALVGRDGPGTLVSLVGPETVFVFAGTEDAENKKMGEYKTEVASKGGGFTDIGGLADQVAAIRELIELPLINPECFLSFGLRPPRGVLMYGPPGTGKTLIARTIAKEIHAAFHIVNGPEIMDKYVGESEARLRSIFQEAARSAPSIVFIDEIDSLCPKRDGAAGEVEKRVVATLLTLLDGTNSSASVVVLAATNRPDALDPALRRPGRLDREIEIGIPSEAGRAEILKIYLRKLPTAITEEEIKAVAARTHGFVGADLLQVTKEAALVALHRAFLSTSAGPAIDVSPLISFEDLVLATSKTRPSALRDVSVEVPKVFWGDIGGQAETKQQLKEAVEWPLKHPEAFVRMGIRAPKGVLLYGPPGCSKTLLAKALATESSMNFIAVKGPELLSRWVGDSEKAVQGIFRKARAAAPTIVFFDEIDALAVQRGGSGGAGGGSGVADRVLSQLLSELDGIESLKRVVVIAATNRPDIIDQALLRPGRIDRLIYVAPPDLEARVEILSIHLRRVPCGPDVSSKDLAFRTFNFSGAELASLCREASMFALEEDFSIPYVSLRHFEKALEVIKPQITKETLQFYQSFKVK